MLIFIILYYYIILYYICIYYILIQHFNILYDTILQIDGRADPAPLTDEDRYRLSWESATERFYDAAYLSGPEGRRRGKPQVHRNI